MLNLYFRTPVTMRSFQSFSSQRTVTSLWICTDCCSSECAHTCALAWENNHACIYLYVLVCLHSASTSAELKYLEIVLQEENIIIADPTSKKPGSPSQAAHRPCSLPRAPHYNCPLPQLCRSGHTDWVKSLFLRLLSILKLCVSE